MLVEKQAVDVDKMKNLIEQVSTFEKEVCQRAKIEREKTQFPDPTTECKPPRWVVTSVVDFFLSYDM